jgi:hypothetical protein
LRVAGLVVTLVVAGAVSAACGSSAPTTAAPPSLPSAASPVPNRSLGPGSSSESTKSSGGLVVADPSLLDRIPAAKAGLSLTYDPDTSASVAADPSLANDAAAIATGLAIPTGQAASPTDFVIVNVVRLRAPKTDDEWFRQWRDSYDQAACEQAGGVSGHAEADLGSHHVHIGTCAGGALTYHTLLDGGSTVLSLTAVGPGRAGEKLMAAVP